VTKPGLASRVLSKRPNARLRLDRDDSTDGQNKPPRTGTYTVGAPLLKYLLPSTLRPLASAIEYRSRESSALCNLTPEGIDKFVDLLMSGGSPTIGFFQRYRQETAA
jgi:hypothetical protein